MRNIGLVFGGLALTIFASPLAAQQTSPDQPPVEQKSPQSVPPATSSDQQTSPESPPPFPPMPARAPQHRFVDMGDHSSRHHATHRTSHAAVSSRVHRRASHTERTTTHTHKATREREAEARPTKKVERRCLKLNVREALRRSECKAVMREQLEPKQEQHRGGHRHAKTHQKATAHQKASHHAAAKHRSRRR